MVRYMLLGGLLGLVVGCSSSGIGNSGFRPMGKGVLAHVVPNCPSETTLCLVPIKLYYLEPSGDLKLQTNNGSNMLLQLENKSNTNIASVLISCGGKKEEIELTVYFPDNLKRYNRDWGGCLMEIANTTREQVPATALVFLVGQ